MTLVSDLDYFTRCQVSGCNWQIERKPGMTADRCFLHGGPAFRQYETASDGVDILRVRFMEREEDPNFDPAA